MNYQIKFNNNRTKQVEQAVKVLASWIGEPNSDSTKCFTLFTIQNNSSEIQSLQLEQAKKINKEDDFIIFLDARKVQTEERELILLSVGDRGLANGLYYLYTKLREAQARDPFSINWNVFQTPHFETRGITLNFPFKLEGLSTDTWNLSEWKAYLNRIRSFNYTTAVVLIGAWMLFHPEFEELKKNSWRYDLYQEVFQYAADIGLEITLLYVFNQINPELWIKFPEIRSTLWLYQGISYCSQKGKEIGEKILKYTLNRFKNVPSVALFAFEGGGCNCEYCRTNIVDLIVAYLDLMKETAKPKRIFFITWFAHVKENFETPSIKGLRANLFSKIPKDIKIVDVTRKTLQMAAAQGYDIFDFIFFLDPEAGMENQAIFPRPHLHLLKEYISDSIQEFGSKMNGMFGYRIIPKTRFIDDYAFGKLLWDPEIGIDSLVSEIAGLLSFSSDEKAQITHVILLLEDFWLTLDKTKLKECKKILKEVTRQQENVPEPLKSIQEATIILNLLFDYYNQTSERRKKGIIQKIYTLMKEMETFHCYTTHQGWEAVSLEMIKQRVQWWTDPGSGLFDPKSFNWKPIFKGKYHLINDKKDMLHWMEFSEIYSQGKQLLSQKFKNFAKKFQKKDN